MTAAALLAAFALLTTPHQHIERPRCHVTEWVDYSVQPTVRVIARTCQRDFPVRRRGLR